MTNYREILRLNSLGINNTQAAMSCGCTRPTVVQVLQRAKAIGLEYSQAAQMSDKELKQKLFQKSASKPEYRMPDYEYVHREMAKSGVTLNLLWLEYCEECRKNHELAYQSTQFNKYYSDYVQKTKATKRIEHKPGDLMETDWAGTTVDIIDTDTGELIPAHLFVAALPYSGYAYVEAFFSEKQDCWIAGHVNAYRYFGGVTRILRPDNLKAGIDKNTREETVVNKAYQEMAEHYGTAVLPARVKRARDKSTVEGSVKLATIWIIAVIRNEHFFSLGELNAMIKEKLEVFNHKPFQKKDGSRHSLFQQEKNFLIPLPKHHFELSEWRQAIVQTNYHIACLKQNYSIPFEYIGRQVDVRITKSMIEVFYSGNRICSHPRLYGHNHQYSTLEGHMPPNHRKDVEWTGDRFRNWAAKFGENTVAVINVFLGNFKIEQQSYKSCRALLHLADKYSAMRLEAACEKAFTYTSRPSLKSVQTILKSGQDKLPSSVAKTSVSSEYGFARGSLYYGGDD
ncbi:MAG: IS21 family transposase [Holophagales bacterium]|jgi:transposase|nr:IS21 family transposase [Holophagales bacterium]